MNINELLNEISDIFQHMFSNILNFKGVEPRKSFWIYYLIIFCFNLIIAFFKLSDSLIYALTSLVLSITIISASIRRLHDTNKSAWYALLLLIPIIGWIIYLVLLAMPHINQNRWSNE